MSSWPPYPNSPSEEENLVLEQSLSEAEELNDFWRQHEKDDDHEENCEGNYEEDDDDIFSSFELEQSNAQPTARLTTPPAAATSFFDQPASSNSSRNRNLYSKERREQQSERLRMAALLTANRFRGIARGDSGPPQGDVVSHLVRNGGMLVNAGEEGSEDNSGALKEVDSQKIDVNDVHGKGTGYLDDHQNLEGNNDKQEKEVSDKLAFQNMNQSLYPWPQPYCPKNMVFAEMNTFTHVKTLLTPRRVRDYELIDSQFLDLEYLQEEISLSENTNFSLAEIAPLLFPNDANVPIVETAAGNRIAIITGEQYRVFLRLARYQRSATVQRDCIPSGLLVIFNGRTFRIPDPAKLQPRDEVINLLRAPFDLTEKLRVAWLEKQESVVTFRPLVDPCLRQVIDPMDDFYFGVYLVKKVDFTAWWNNFVLRWAENPLSPERSLALAKRIFTKIDRVTVSLQCPMTAARIGTPCRSTKCTGHLQCFDGQSLVIRNQDNFFWRCPVRDCGERISLNDLFVDGLFLEILSVAPPLCDQAEVFSDGQWRCITKKLDFTVTVIDQRNEDEMKMSTVQPQSSVNGNDNTGSSSIKPGVSSNINRNSSFSSSSFKQENFQQVSRMTESVSEVVQIIEEEEEEEGESADDIETLKMPDGNAAHLVRRKKRTAEMKSTSPLNINIPKKRSSRVIKPTTTVPEFSYML